MRICYDLLNERMSQVKKTNTITTYGRISDKKRMTAFFLCLFLGCVGVHRFYVGKYGSGLLYFFTSGGFVIMAIVDLIAIIRGTFTDASGAYLAR